MKQNSTEATEYKTHPGSLQVLFLKTGKSGLEVKEPTTKPVAETLGTLQSVQFPEAKKWLSGRTKLLQLGHG